MSWELIWKFVLITTFLLFAVMSVLVTFLGARDIQRLLLRLKDDETKD